MAGPGGDSDCRSRRGFTAPTRRITKRGGSSKPVIRSFIASFDVAFLYSEGDVSKFNNLTHRPMFHPDGEGAVRMAQMVGA